MYAVKAAIFFFLEKLVRWCVHGKIRSVVVRWLGGKVGQNVRINEVQFSGISNGFENLFVGDNSFLGDGSFIDLTGEVHIGSRTSVSPRCVLITHQDPGSMLENKLAELFSRETGQISIGNDSWIGAGTIILSGVSIGNYVVLGAGSIVTKDIPSNSIAYGNPARVVKRIYIREHNG
jgi:maltose O-acetyltransferase